jgi:hypothetical protein
MSVLKPVHSWGVFFPLFWLLHEIPQKSYTSQGVIHETSKRIKRDDIVIFNAQGTIEFNFHSL